MKSACLFILLISISSIHLFASDTTYRKNPWHMSIAMGPNYNSVGGSMVDFDKTFNDMAHVTAEQKNTVGWFINYSVQKNFADAFYVKSGLSFIHKQVNPQENTDVVYRDSMNTGYLSIPALIGISAPLNLKKTIGFFAETGLAGNLKITDHSYHPPDRIGFETLPVVLSFQFSAGFTFGVWENASFILQYGYSADLTNAYKETRYFGAPQMPIYVGYYKYFTNSVSLGVQWGL
jgi:hypothetical protein